MRCGSRLDRFATALLIVSVGIVVSGTKACQEDYDFASQSNARPDTTASATPSATGEATETATATPTGGTPVSTGTTTPSPTPLDEDDGDETAKSENVFTELSKLGENSESLRGAGAAAAAVAGASAAGSAGGNWLGGAFTKEGETWQDSDNDGYSDAFERAQDSDPSNAVDVPKFTPTTSLNQRINKNDVEIAREADEDSVDTDGDTISDDVETQRGMDPQTNDSDKDGLTDERELIVGTNPLKIDSDGDGVSDGREYDSGADPTLADLPKPASQQRDQEP
ncbi:MAG: hypothetical protein ACK5Y6_04970 [Pseudomonadota bacterium]